jgi:hypothetical protein
VRPDAVRLDTLRRTPEAVRYTPELPALLRPDAARLDTHAYAPMLCAGTSDALRLRSDGSNRTVGSGAYVAARPRRGATVIMGVLVSAASLALRDFAG